MGQDWGGWGLLEAVDWLGSREGWSGAGVWGVGVAVRWGWVLGRGRRGGAWADWLPVHVTT